MNFSPDLNTLIASSKDGKISFWNVKDNYKLLSSMKCKPTEEENDIEEINATHMINIQGELYLIIGGQSGIIQIFDIKN